MSDTLVDLLIGLVLLAVGAGFCFRGYLAMRIIIPIWGALTGAVLGFGLVANLGSEGFAATALGWVVALSLGFVFGLLAYLYYEVAIVLAMSAIGFAIGSTLMAVLGVEWSWLIVVGGVIVGILLAVVAILGDLPMVLLTVLTAMAGASTMVAGVLLAIGTIDTGELSEASTTVGIGDDWWWTVAYAVLTVGGIVTQLRSTRRREASLRQTWATDGGRQLRSTPG